MYNSIIQNYIGKNKLTDLDRSAHYLVINLVVFDFFN